MQTINVVLLKGNDSTRAALDLQHNAIGRTCNYIKMWKSSHNSTVRYTLVINYCAILVPDSVLQNQDCVAITGNCSTHFFHLEKSCCITIATCISFEDHLIKREFSGGNSPCWSHSKMSWKGMPLTRQVLCEKRAYSTCPLLLSSNNNKRFWL